MTELPLPGMPEPPPVNPRPVKPGVRAARTKAGHLCAQCCRLIHVLGVATAPYPKGGRWRVTGPDFAEYLCDAHKDERLS